MFSRITPYIYTRTQRILLSLLILTGLSSSFIPGTAFADDPFWEAITGGKVHFSVRYRFEHVNDDILFAPPTTKLKDANASTIRTFLGYETGKFYDFSATLDFENVTDVFSGDFFDGSNRKTRYATVVDPSGTEVDQSFISYTGLPDTQFKLGRQYITYRDAPFHRFIGTILWRQNWQTFDAFTATNTSIKDTQISYAYVWNVNRIFGEDAISPLDNFDSNSHFINIQNTSLPFGKLEGYAYLLDFDNAAAFSTQTYGVRFSGKHPLSEKIAGLYTAEYAHQSDYRNNPGNISADYFLGEAGLQFKPALLIDSFILKFSYELLGGDGGVDRFVTILGTNHAFQGWADRFLVTPGDGIEDYIITAVANIKGANFVAAWHNLNSDNMNYDYGNELDLMLSRTFKEKYTLGIKYSIYDAAGDATSIARNGANNGVNRDVDKFWVWAQFKY